MEYFSADSKMAQRAPTQVVCKGLDSMTGKIRCYSTDKTKITALYHDDTNGHVDVNTGALYVRSLTGVTHLGPPTAEHNTNVYGDVINLKCYSSGGGEITAFAVDFNGGVRLPTHTSYGSVGTDGLGYINNLSDAAVKSDIQYLTETTDAVGAIKQLKPATFRYLSDPRHERLGFIAQDVENVIPWAVDGKKLRFEPKQDDKGNVLLDEEGQPILTDKPRYRTLDTTAIISTLCLAVQQLTARLEALEAA